MRAGLLRNTILIESVAEAQNDYGEAVETWSTFKTVRAAKRYLDGSENEVNDVRSPVRMVEFRLHYFPGVTNKMRINHNGDIFNILFIENVGELNRDLVIRCREAV